MRKQFCNHGEFLLFINASHGGYVHESDMQQMTEKEAAHEAGDHIKQIIRTDKCNWTCEDVTEEVAMAWLTSDMVDPADPRKFPLYVRQSAALDIYTAEYAQSKADFLAMRAQGVA